MPGDGSLAGGEIAEVQVVAPAAGRDAVGGRVPSRQLEGDEDRVPAGPLDAALAAFAAVTGVTVTVSPALASTVQVLQSPGVAGAYAIEQALQEGYIRGLEGKAMTGPPTFSTSLQEPVLVLSEPVRRGDEAQGRERLSKLQPWPAHGRGEHIASAALFLASDESEFVTGEALVVDGGLTAAGPSLPSRRRETTSDDVASQFDFVGLDWGTTGKAAVVRKLAPKE